MHQNLCQEALCSMFLSRAREEVCAYYEAFLTVKPHLTIYCCKLVRIRYSPGDRPAYLLDFDLYPYIGNHCTIAVCRMCLRIDRYDGDVRTLEFRQLRSYPLPDTHWDCIKQPF